MGVGPAEHEACGLTNAVRRDFLGCVEGDVGDGDAASAVSGVAGGDLHFAERPDVVGDFHDVLDLEFLHHSAVFVVAADAHEGAKLGVDPDVNDFVTAGGAFGFVHPEFITGLAADVFGAFEFGIGPIEEAQGEVLVGEVGAGDGLDDFFGGKGGGLAVGDLEKVEGLIADADVEDPLRDFVFGKLELDVLALEE